MLAKLIALGGSDKGHRAYVQLTCLGLAMHVSHVLIFTLLNCPMTALYNMLSVFFYLFMLWLLCKKRYITVVSCIHLEVSMFCIVTVVACGWEVGTSLFLIAVSSLVYFCPYDSKYIPYIFSGCELSIFVFLRFYSYTAQPIYTHLSDDVYMALYLYSSFCCFAIVLFASFSSNISAIVSNKKLHDENESLQQIVKYDMLTGLFSRRAFLERVENYSQVKNHVVAIGDLDDFKLVNDTYGHNTGDYVLSTVGKIIQMHSNPRTICCRWGGEEFVFLFRQGNFNVAHRELETLRKKIEGYRFHFQGTDIKITMTFGLCEGMPDPDILELIQSADTLLYRGKQSGKNNVNIKKPE